MSAGLIGSFETKFNEILWLSQSNFLWEEVRKRVGHASSLLNKICLCLCFFYMSLCLSFYLSLSLYICVFNFFCGEPNGIWDYGYGMPMQAPFQLVDESLFPGFQTQMWNQAANISTFHEQFNWLPAESTL